MATSWAPHAVAVCPGWVSTNFFPAGLLGRILAAAAFPLPAGVRAPLCAGLCDLSETGTTSLNAGRAPVPPPPLLEVHKPGPKSGPGIFVSNAGLARGVSSDFFSALNNVVGLRDYLLWPLAVLHLLVQRLTYGCHIESSSPESHNEALQEALWEWSLEATTQWRK